MKLFNTLSKQLEDVKPLEDKKIKFYHCGPTVYWTQHIGNLRAMTMGDLIRRSLLYLGYDVNYVRNYTDVGHLTSDEDEGEDKMEKGAKREGISPEEIADKYIKIFENDVSDLNLLEPTHKSKVTTCIEEIIKMIQILLDKGAAYETPKAIYFDVTRAKDYPAFSKKKLEDQIEGAGSGDVTDKEKKHPADFALWFFRTGAHENALQTWKSPFNSPDIENGRGFPGWHIECSVIAQKFLGETLDIHMGGIEHTPIHHPNEIAQSEVANDAKFANIWLHNEHLTVNDRKMAKSEGTGYSLAEIKEKGFDPLDLRYFFLTAHYRSKQNFTWEALGAARTARLKLIEGLKTIKSKGNIIEDSKDRFMEAISADVNIPKALAIVWETLKLEGIGSDMYATIIDFDKVLGLELENSLLTEDISKEKHNEIMEQLDKREELRKQKKFEEADKIREQLEKKYNIEIEDAQEGATWRNR